MAFYVQGRLALAAAVTILVACGSSRSEDSSDLSGDDDSGANAGSSSGSHTGSSSGSSSGMHAGSGSGSGAGAGSSSGSSSGTGSSSGSSLGSSAGAGSSSGSSSGTGSSSGSSSGGIVDAGHDAGPDAGTDAGAAPHTLANVGWGIVNPGGYTTWAADLAQVEGVVGRHIDLAMDFVDWSSGTDPFPTVPAEILSGIGDRPFMWTVQPSGVDWASLIAGDYDTELVAFADWVNMTITSTLYLRFAHEMNGTGWYNWQVGGSCGVTSAADYAQGFNHVASVLKANSTHIAMVWAVNNGPTANIASFYPSGCDVMGFDSYNFGPNTSSTGVSAGGASSTWTEASPLNMAAYQALAAADPNKPIWICETSSEDPSAPWNPTTYDPSGYTNNVVIAAQPTHDKGEWVANFLAETDMPRIAMIVWFDTQKERDWLFDSSTSSTSAFNAGFAASRDGGVYWNPATGGQ